MGVRSVDDRLRGHSGDRILIRKNRIAGSPCIRWARSPARTNNVTSLPVRPSNNNIFLSLFFLCFLFHENFLSGKWINFREIHQARVR